MRRLILIIASVYSCALAQTTTTVTEQVVTASGAAASGKADIRITGACQSGTYYVGQFAIEVKFNATTPAQNGGQNNFSVTLIPNDLGGCAGSSYSVTWTLTGGKAWTETWVVPTSATPMLVGSVAVQAPVAPTWRVQLQQLAGLNLGCFPYGAGSGTAALCPPADGEYAVLFTAGVPSWTPGGGGGGGATPCLDVVTYSPSPTFNFGVCPQQEIVLTGNVTPAISGAGYCQVAGGCTITFIQGSGNYAVTWTGAVLGGFSIGSISGKRNVQSFTSLDGSTLLGLNPGEINQ